MAQLKQVRMCILTEYNCIKRVLERSCLERGYLKNNPWECRFFAWKFILESVGEVLQILKIKLNPFQGRNFKIELFTSALGMEKKIRGKIDKQ